MHVLALATACMRFGRGAAAGASSATAEPEAPSAGAAAASVHIGGIALMAPDGVPRLARSHPTEPAHQLGFKNPRGKIREIRGYFSGFSVVSSFSSSLSLFSSLTSAAVRLTGQAAAAAAAPPVSHPQCTTASL